MVCSLPEACSCSRPDRSVPIDHSSDERTNATLAELKYLVDTGQLGKCIFFRPAEQEIFVPEAYCATGASANTTVSAKWNVTQARYAAFGFLLPIFFPSDGDQLSTFWYQNGQVNGSRIRRSHPGLFPPSSHVVPPGADIDPRPSVARPRSQGLRLSEAHPTTADWFLTWGPP
jgi:hypothetical protein